VVSLPGEDVSVLPSVPLHARAWVMLSFPSDSDIEQLKSSFEASITIPSVNVRTGKLGLIDLVQKLIPAVRCQQAVPFLTY